MGRIGNSTKGIFRDILIRTDNQVAYDSGWVANTIVDNCRVLIAGLMKNDFSAGIQFLAVGKGDEEWDSMDEPPKAESDKTDLESRYAITVPDTVSDSGFELDYLDENDEVVAGPTSRLQITATLRPGYPAPISPLTTYPLREFGLFGHADGSDYMINNVRHPVIHKDATATLIRVIRLYF